MSGIYPAPWRIIGTLMDKNGDVLASIEDANGTQLFGLVKLGLAERMVEAFNRAAYRESVDDKRERFKMEENWFSWRLKAEKLEELLRELVAEASKYASEGDGLRDLAKEAMEYCNSVAQSDYADCIDYARYLLEKHEEGKREKVCGVDLGDGPSEGKMWIVEVKGPDGTVRRWKVTPKGEEE